MITADMLKKFYGAPRITPDREVIQQVIDQLVAALAKTRRGEVETNILAALCLLTDQDDQPKG